MSFNNVLVAYFSGTGCTARAADAFEAELVSRGLSVNKQEIKTGKRIPNGSEDLLILLFAVHAANAPLPVYRWLESMDGVEGIPAVVISVSGGGEVFPNTACRLSSIKRLENKGYDIVYEYMLMMPSNMFIETPEFLAKGLLRVLPDKVKKITDEFLSGFRRRTKPKIIDKLLSHFLEVEKIGAKHFGKGLLADKTCTGCGLCEKNCPGANIRIENGKPLFADRCVMCFKCVYGCPLHAIHAKRLGFTLNKKGFNIRNYEKPGDLPAQKTGIVRKTVQSYIDQKDI